MLLDNTIASRLSAIHLAEYTSALEQEGYDVELLSASTKEELDGIAKILGMKSGHALKFVKAFYSPPAAPVTSHTMQREGPVQHIFVHNSDFTMELWNVNDTSYHCCVEPYPYGRIKAPYESFNWGGKLSKEEFELISEATAKGFQGTFRTGDVMKCFWACIPLTMFTVSCLQSCDNCGAEARGAAALAEATQHFQARGIKFSLVQKTEFRAIKFDIQVRITPSA